MSNQIKLSLVIPARDINDPNLKELLRSIDFQDFPKEQLEVLVIIEGTSESAKAIGIRRAKGEVIGILASDNELIGNHFLKLMYDYSMINESCYPSMYYYSTEDDVLNRYFSLIGGNDPLSFYMKKNDRFPHFYGTCNVSGSLGDNGFFVKKSLIEKTDLDNYYHIDNSVEAVGSSNPVLGAEIWHKTGGNIFKFFAKRYRYGLQHAFNKNRRWHLVDFSKLIDIWRLTWFIFATLTIIQPLCLSIRGWLKIRDAAWFLHWPCMVMTLLTYGFLVLNRGIKRLSQSLSVPTAVRRA